MIAAVDIGYHAHGATAAAVVFEHWRSPAAFATYATDIAEVEAYVPGEFYRRELPCIEAVLRTVRQPIDVVVIDGFVFLGPSRLPGLGARLWEALGGNTPVVVVAKTRYAGTPQDCEVRRGQNTKPLFVTAIGMSEETARLHVLEMAGRHRIPDLLKHVDTHSRRHAWA